MLASAGGVFWFIGRRDRLPTIPTKKAISTAKDAALFDIRYLSIFVRNHIIFRSSIAPSRRNVKSICAVEMRIISI